MRSRLGNEWTAMVRAHQRDVGVGEVEIVMLEGQLLDPVCFSTSRLLAISGVEMLVLLCSLGCVFAFSLQMDLNGCC